MRKTTEQRFWEKVNKTNGCWLWTAYRLKRSGYGMFGSKSHTLVLAHRFSYELIHGPIPAGLNVLHRCDTPACVNPDHLFLGSQMENVQDCIQKGRFRPTRKVTIDMARSIRTEYSAKVGTMRALGLKYGLDSSTVCHIVHHKIHPEI